MISLIPAWRGKCFHCWIINVTPPGPKQCLHSCIYCYASEAVSRISGGEKSHIAGLVGDGLEHIDASIVGVVPKEGDALACHIIDKAANYLGIVVANLANIFNPELIIVGGGMSCLRDMLLEPAKRVVRERAFQLPARSLRIVPSQFRG